MKTTVMQDNHRFACAKHALGLMDAYDFGSEGHETAGIAAWVALGPGGREQLCQLLKGPTGDGDVISKRLRDELLALGLAVRCCLNGEQGYTAASYKAFTVHRIGQKFEGVMPRRQSESPPTPEREYTEAQIERMAEALRKATISRAETWTDVMKAALAAAGEP